MNHRIDQFAYRAGLYCTGVQDLKVIEDFAILIIKECAAVAFFEDNGKESYIRIREHFGVNFGHAPGIEDIQPVS